MDDFGFRFKVGDFAGLLAQEHLPVNLRHRLHILERTLQQCPGGIQRHYTVRSHAIDGSAAATKGLMNEIELCEAPVWDSEDASNEGARE